MSVYDFKPDKFSSHMKIINYLKSISQKNKGKKLKVLDVGCSKGFIGKILKDFNFELYGIELDREDAKIAKKYYKEIRVANLELKKNLFKKIFFDIIIMADIIEHLRNSSEIVGYLKKFLKKDGMLILSTGNIANLYVRLKLLFGNFDYEERGILDKTHLKLFTLKTFRQLATNAGLKIVGEDFTPIPLPTVNKIFVEGNPLNLAHKINYYLMRIFPKLLSFQFILYCKKEN